MESQEDRVVQPASASKARVRYALKPLPALDRVIVAGPNGGALAFKFHVQVPQSESLKVVFEDRLCGLRQMDIDAAIGLPRNFISSTGSLHGFQALLSF